MRPPAVEPHLIAAVALFDGLDMVIMDGGAEQDIIKLWSLVVELSEQLTKTRTLAGSLHSQSIQLKVSVSLCWTAWTIILMQRTSSRRPCMLRLALCYDGE